MTEDGFDAIPERKPIASGEWVISVQFNVDDKPYGEPFVMRYADSVLAKNPKNVVYLICRRMQESGSRFGAALKAAKKRPTRV